MPVLDEDVWLGRNQAAERPSQISRCALNRGLFGHTMVTRDKSA